MNVEGLEMVGYENSWIINDFFEKEKYYRESLPCKLIIIWLQSFMWDFHYCFLKNFLKLYKDYICVLTNSELKFPFKYVIVIKIDIIESLERANCLEKKEYFLPDVNNTSPNIRISDLVRIVYGNRINAMYIDLDYFLFKKFPEKWDINEPFIFHKRLDGQHSNVITNNLFKIFNTDFGRNVEKMLCDNFDPTIGIGHFSIGRELLTKVFKKIYNENVTGIIDYIPDKGEWCQEPHLKPCDVYNNWKECECMGIHLAHRKMSRGMRKGVFFQAYRLVFGVVKTSQCAYGIDKKYVRSIDEIKPKKKPYNYLKWLQIFNITTFV